MRMKMLRIALLAAAGAALFAATVPLASGATSHGRKATTARASVTVNTRTVAGYGKILVNGAGRTLYMFVPDKHKRVTCFKTCAVIWPPLKLPAGGKIVGRGGVKAKLLGSDRDAAGGRVITYNRWPLYLYKGDTKVGTAYGQGEDMNGGYWYVMSPTGAVIKHKVKKTTTGTTTTISSTTTVVQTTSTPSQCLDDDNDGDQNVGGPDDGDGCL